MHTGSADDKIATLIKNQMPEYYQEYGPILVEFVKQYFSWLEQEGNVVHYARSHVLNRDVDVVIEQFLNHFKQKYAPQFQLETALATRRVIKASLPFYRARGTEQAFKMFFKMVFGEDCEIYRPALDLFTLSSGDWQNDIYLEVSPKHDNMRFVNQPIFGNESGAQAYVDRYVRRVINERIVDVLYISAVYGRFRTGESLTIAEQATANPPTVVGSIRSLEPVNGGLNFVVGDKAVVTSRSGRQGLARVTNVYSVSGLVDFQLIDGGWGYSTNTSIYISNVSAHVINATRPYTGNATYLLSNVTQPMCQIRYQNANVANIWSVGDQIYCYYANNAVAGHGTVLHVTNATANAGFVWCSTKSGNLAANVNYYTTGNTGYANLYPSGYTDKTATGSLLNIPTTVRANFTNATASFVVGEPIYQINAVANIAAGYVSDVSIAGGNGVVTITNCSTVPFTNTLLRGATSGAQANCFSLEFDIGIYTTSSYDSTANNLVVIDTLCTNGSISLLSSGYGASFLLSPELSYPEQISYNTDQIADYLNVLLDAPTYGANLNNANLSNFVLNDALNFFTGNVGGLTALISVNPGSGYNFIPYVLLIDPVTAYYYKYDYTFAVTNATGVFSIGEVVTQSATGGRGKVWQANTSVVKIRRMNFEDVWMVSNTTATTLLVGEASGYSAKIANVQSDEFRLPIGQNALVSANVVTGTGVVSNLEVIASGFAFDRSLNYDGTYEDLVTFTSLDGLRSGTAFAIIDGQGKSAGYYKSRNGFLSSNKKLADQYYWQNFSYDVKTPIAPDRYVNMLKKLLHTAGMLYFTSVIKVSDLDVAVDILPSELSIVDA